MKQELEEKHLIWNERKPKISTKYIPHEDLVENPAHNTMSQIKEEKHLAAREKVNLTKEPTEIKSHVDP